VARAVHYPEDLRERKHKVENLREEEKKHSLCKVAEDAHHSKSHTCKIAESVPHEDL